MASPKPSAPTVPGWFFPYVKAFAPFVELLFCGQAELGCRSNDLRRIEPVHDEGVKESDVLGLAKEVKGSGCEDIREAGFEESAL